MRVDAAVETRRRTTTRQIEQLIAIEHTLRSLDQCNQQIVFAGAQRHRDTIVATGARGNRCPIPSGRNGSFWGAAQNCPSPLVSWLRRSTALIRAISSRLPNGFGR